MELPLKKAGFANAGPASQRKPSLNLASSPVLKASTVPVAWHSENSTQPFSSSVCASNNDVFTPNPTGPMFISLRPSPIMRLEVVGRCEFILVSLFTVVIWLGIVLLLLISPDWTVTSDEYPINGYCDTVTVGNQTYPWNTNETCDFACWSDLSARDMGEVYVSAYDDCTTQNDDPICMNTNETGYLYSCPYDGVALKDMEVLTAGPIAEYTISHYLDRHALKGSFDIHIQFSRAKNASATGEGSTMPESMQLSYAAIVQGMVKETDFIRLKVIYNDTVDLQCDLEDADSAYAYTCEALLIPAFEIKGTTGCEALKRFQTIVVQVIYTTSFSALQSTLNVTSIGQGNNTALIPGVRPYVTDTLFNTASVRYVTTSSAFQTFILVTHVVLGVVMFVYGSLFVYKAYWFAGEKFRDWHIERKWAAGQILCAFTLAANPMYFVTGALYEDATSSVQTMMSILDTMIVNCCLGMIFFLNLCFLSSYRLPDQVYHRGLLFYSWKLLFLAIWTMTLIGACVAVVKEVHDENTPLELAPGYNVGSLLTSLLLAFYFICMLIVGIRTRRAFKGEWNYGMRHRQLAFRIMCSSQMKLFVVALIEGFLSQFLRRYGQGVYIYEPYTGFATLFITSFGFNVTVVLIVFATTYSYLPPTQHEVQKNECKVRLLTNSTHVHGEFSLYTMHWMCAGSRLAYKYKPIPSTHSAGDVADDIYISTSIANPRKNVCTHVVSTEKVSKPDFSQPIRADGGSLECAPGVAEHLGNAPRGPTRVGEFREGTGRVELIPVVSRDSNPMEISPDVSEGGLNLSEKGLVGSQPRLYSYDMPLGPNLSSAQQTLIISPHAAHTLLEPIVPEALEGGTRSQIHAPSDPHTNTQQTSTPATAQTYTPAQQTDRDRREETWVEREGSCTRRRNTYDSEQVHHTRVDVERYDTSGNSVDNGRTDGNAECDAHGPRRPPDMNGEDIDTAMSRAEMSRAEMSRAEMSRAEMSRAEVPRATEARAVQEDANGKFEVVAYISDARTDTHCVVFRQQGELVVSFRGTKSSGNAMTDMQANLIPLCASTCGTVNKIWHKHTCERWSECRTKDLLVHRGFLTAYQSVRVRVLDVVRKQMASYKTETRKEMALYMTESRDVVPRERRHRILNATASTVGAASTAHVGGSEKCPTAHAMPRGDRETLYSPQNLTGDMSLECCSGPGNDKGVGGSESLCTYSGNPPQDPSGTTARVSMEDGYVSALTEARTNTHANGPTPRGYVSEMHQNTINKGGCIAKKDNYAVEVACMKTPASSMENIQGTSAAAGARERTSIILNPFLGFCKPRSDTGLRIYNRRKSQSAPDLGNETPFSVVFEPDTGLKSYDGSGLNNTKHAETGKRVYDMPEVCSGYEPSEPNNSNETTYTAQIPVQRTDLDEVHNPFHVFITGHSLGGALATLCAYEFSRVFAGAELALTVYTFGSPRVGNHQYAWLYNERIPNTYRIVNDGDPITALPPKIAGTAFLNTYKHVGTCYTLAETGSLVMNPNFIERRLQLKPKREISTHSIRQYRSFIVRCLARYVSGASGGERTKTCEAYELATALRSITSVLQAPSEMGTLELDAMEGITDGLTVPEAQSSGAKMRQLLHRTRSVDHVVYR